MKAILENEVCFEDKHFQSCQTDKPQLPRNINARFGDFRKQCVLSFKKNLVIKPQREQTKGRRKKKLKAELRIGKAKKHGVDAAKTKFIFAVLQISQLPGNSGI